MLVKIDFKEDSFKWDYLPVFMDRSDVEIVKGECPAMFTDIDPKKLQVPLATFGKRCLSERESEVCISL